MSAPKFKARPLTFRLNDNTAPESFQQSSTENAAWPFDTLIIATTASASFRTD